jgi:hypothetical protein
MSTFTIVGCGDTAKDWQPNGHSIGVNDSWKWGKETDSLLVCNNPFRFTEQRREIIKNSKPKIFYCNNASWSFAFPDWQKLNLKPWYNVVNPNCIYYSNTSPFIAISLAYTLGAKDIILWGVDFKTHHIYTETNPQTKREVERYLELIKCLKELGTNTWLGTAGTGFDEHLEVYK